MKYLVLMNGRFGIDRYFIANTKHKELEIASIYRLYKKNFMYSLAALWMEKIGLPFENLWYENWKNKLDKYDTVIVFASNLSWKVISYIKNKNPYCRIIVWYWDTVSDKRKLPEKYKEICEEWSFDQKDCEKYGLCKNSQFFLLSNKRDEEIIYEAMFIGRDKGRVKQLYQIKRFFEENNLRIYIYVPTTQAKRFAAYKEHEKEMEYNDVLNIVSESRCIIDIPKVGQNGITMRVLEAMFFSKKLITTDLNIRMYDFYNKNNIFIWGEDPIEEIIDFINSEYQTIDPNIKKYYLIEEWIKRFERMELV